MKKEEVAKLATQKTVLKVLDDFSGTWSNFKPISAKVVQLRSLTDAIESDSKIQRSSRSTGFSTPKKEAFANMLDAAYKIAVKLKDWAKETHNGLVYDAANYSRSRLNASTFAEKLGRCQLILAKAEENAGALGDYHITADAIAAFRLLTITADALTLDKDAADTTHRMATGGIATKIKKVNALLASLDELVEGFTGEGDADFVAAYFAAHKSMNHHSSRKKPAAIVGKKVEAAA